MRRRPIGSSGLSPNGGQVHMPLAKTIFLTRFGIVADRFGVSCMVLVEP
jgi:PhnB protein